MAAAGLDIDTQALSKVDDQGFVLPEERDKMFRKLRMKNENRTCFECSCRNPTWISLTYGVYVCLECSGEHRRKGVHLSYVRSVDMDKFRPDQMIQMAIGGNGKAWAHFKAHGMGKTSETGRPVDYNSKITQRYKAIIDKETEETCRKYGIHMRGDAVEKPAAAAEPTQPAAATNGAAAATPATAPAAAAPAAATPAPKATGIIKVNQPQIIRKVVPTPAATNGPVSAAAPEIAAPAKPAVASTKQVAKEIDFDFDFDDIEAEAKKPVPKPQPKATPTPAPTPSVTPAPVKISQPATTSESGGVDKKFNNAKGISSADFFADETQESPQERMEREARYAKMAGSGAISSDAFFGDGQGNEGGNDSGWKDAARGGLAAGASMVSSYLAKGRN